MKLFKIITNCVIAAALDCGMPQLKDPLKHVTIDTETVRTPVS
jgi:hypothetical protein